MTENNTAPRALSRNETHDLGMIIKDRCKVLRAHAEEQAAACMADFERKLATSYCQKRMQFPADRERRG
jgi:hypothetical protein